MDKNFESTYNIQVNPEIFIQFSRKCGQKHEIMDKNIKLWTNISSLLMNIQVNPESVDNYSLSLDNIVYIFWKIV
jgi:hypothetical protein